MMADFTTCSKIDRALRTEPALAAMELEPDYLLRIFFKYRRFIPVVNVMVGYAGCTLFSWHPFD
jgi:hypothetical protein